MVLNNKLAYIVLQPKKIHPMHAVMVCDAKFCNQKDTLLYS